MKEKTAEEKMRMLLELACHISQFFAPQRAAHICKAAVTVDEPRTPTNFCYIFTCKHTKRVKCFFIYCKNLFPFYKPAFRNCIYFQGKKDTEPRGFKENHNHGVRYAFLTPSRKSRIKARKIFKKKTLHRYKHVFVC